MFPDQRYNAPSLFFKAYRDELQSALATVSPAAFDSAVRVLAARASLGRTVYTCGNGGSAAIANHLVCDCMKGMRTGTTLRPKVHSLVSNMELLTALANDISYEEVFATQLSYHAERGDLLIVISSSGNSPNILNALARAKHEGITTIAMTGFDGGAAAKMCDISLHVNASNYGIVEDAHQALMHSMAQCIRHSNIDESSLGRVKF